MLKLFKGGKDDGNKTGAPPETTAPPTAPVSPNANVDANASDSPQDAALDALGSVLRSLGDEAFDVGDETAATIRSRFSAWSRHLLVAGPHPDNPDDGPTRDFRGVRIFVGQFRRREVAFVVRTLKELRTVLGTMVGQLGAAIVADKKNDGRAVAQLQRLQRAVSSASVPDLQREAIATVDCLHQLIEERKERQTVQVATLREQVQAINEELSQARQAMALDPLTRLYNRGALDEQLDRTTHLAALTGQEAVLFMVDIDNFKKVNDSYGHPIGDLVIKAVADSCVRCFPRQRDFVARYGGEEFAVIAFDAPPTSLAMLADRLLGAVRRVQVTVGSDAVPVAVTISVGAAPVIAGEDAPTWMRRADAALYQAKNAGRDRAVIAPNEA
jgi:diguanylate cyclase